MESRTINSIRNISFGLIAQLVNNVFVFLTRSVFIYTLGKNYLGLNGLFGDILALLSLAELGIGTAIIYSMYKPIAEKDNKKVSALLNLYRKVYIFVGIITTIVGLVIGRYLNFFISDLPTIDNIKTIYILFLLNTTLSYFWSYKKSILIADQKVFKISLIQTIISFIQNIAQIIILIKTKNYILFLIIMLACTIATNIFTSFYVDNNYKFLKENREEKLTKVEKEGILINIKGMFINKLSSVIVTSTDNLLISKYVSTVSLGYYSNYTLFVNLLRQLTSKVFEALTGSVGNLIAKESDDKIYITYSNIWFINFWISGFLCLGLYCVINPFITIWIGADYILNKVIVFFICFNLYMRLIRNTFLMYIDTYGLFYDMKWKCIIEALSNIIFSIVYLKVFNMGIIGVLLGTFTSNIITNFWFEPFILYSKKFNKSLKLYFAKFFKYISCIFISGFICEYVFYTVDIKNIWSDLIFRGLICTLIFNSLFIIIFRKSKEFKFFLRTLYKLLNRKVEI